MNLATLTERTRSPLAAFILGALEFLLDYTWTDPERETREEYYTALDEAYDWGREWAHRLTFRRFDA